MIRPTPRWKIELQAATHPKEEWVTLRHESGREYKFVERTDAETAMAKLRRSQPHAMMRIAPM